MLQQLLHSLGALLLQTQTANKGRQSKRQHIAHTDSGTRTEEDRKNDRTRQINERAANGKNGGKTAKKEEKKGGVRKWTPN